MQSDLNDIRSRSIVDYLSLNGHHPSRVTERNTWYLSPIHPENNPSFVVKNNTNRWMDHGCQKHGSLIDLVMELEGVSMHDACMMLSSNRKLEHHIATAAPKIAISLIDALPLTDDSLLRYMRSRGIPDNLSTKYCKEVYYTYTKSDPRSQSILRAVGFKSELGGYELRSTLQKVCVGTKCYTRIPGNTSKYYLFEGWIDFLSALAYFGVEKPAFETFILNGTGQLNLITPFLEGRTGKLFVDNDKGGQGIIDTLQQEDCRGIYSGYKDFNEFLTSKL